MEISNIKYNYKVRTLIIIVIIGILNLNFSSSQEFTNVSDGNMILNTIRPPFKDIITNGPFSTYLGGKNFDFSQSIATDQTGNVYITGGTNSSNFPIVDLVSGINHYSGGFDSFVARFGTNGNLTFSNLLGGSSSDIGTGIAVDHNENIYITGTTSSSNFPTKNAYNSTYGGGTSDIFVTKYDKYGDLQFSTFLGGSSSDISSGIAVDNQGNCYITGQTSSPNFPIKNAFNSSFNGNTDSFFAKFNSFGSLLFSSYFGGFNDTATGITVDSSGNIYITGNTYSKIFPTKNTKGTIFSGASDVFITKFNSSMNLVYSAFLGGSSNDFANSIAIDSNGNCYVVGTSTSMDFPTTYPVTKIYKYNKFPFVTKFGADGKILFSMTLGNTFYGQGTGIAVNSYGTIFITGNTNSTNNIKSINDFIIDFNPDGSLISDTTVGDGSDNFATGIAVDQNNNTFITGYTSSSKFPVKNAYDPLLSGSFDAFIIEYSFRPISQDSLNEIITFLVLIFAIPSLIYIFIEYRKYKKIQSNTTNSNRLSFKKYLIEKLKRINFRRIKVRSSVENQLTKDTFDLLEEIINENQKDE